MNSATSLGNAVKISTPSLSWEKVGANVNEGPGKSRLVFHLEYVLIPRLDTYVELIAAIYHGGRTWIAYSASNCAGTGYKLGILELTGSNPLSASSWTKNPNPIFQSANGNNQVRFKNECPRFYLLILLFCYSSPGTTDSS